MKTSIETALHHCRPEGMRLLKKHAIGAGASVKETLSALNALSGDVMTLFVIEADGRPLGTVTDGDIRRALIAGTPLDGSIRDVAHRNFLACSDLDDLCRVMGEARKRHIELLPILDAGFIADIIDMRHARTSLPIDAVLMAGGRGERLRPLTLDTPKPLLEIGGKPIIDYNVDELEACGVRNIFVTVNYLGDQIKEHFRMRPNRACIECVEEPKRLGTMGSLALVEGLSRDNVLVMNSDLLTNIDFEKLYLHHSDQNADFTVAAIPYTVSVPFAIMNVAGRRVTGLSEKPTYNYFANAGVYIMRREVVGMITPGEYLDAPDFIEQLIAAGRLVSFFPIDGTWIDIGSPDDFRYANELMSQRFKS